MRSPAIFLLAAFCATLGLSIAWLKVTRLAVPLDPAAEAIVWDVEALPSGAARSGYPEACRMSAGIGDLVDEPPPG